MRCKQEVQFDPAIYLESFYARTQEHLAMNFVMFSLVGLLQKLPAKVKTLLDLGAGKSNIVPETSLASSQDLPCTFRSPSVREPKRSSRPTMRLQTARLSSRRAGA